MDKTIAEKAARISTITIELKRMGEEVRDFEEKSKEIVIGRNVGFIINYFYNTEVIFKLIDADVNLIETLINNRKLRQEVLEKELTELLEVQSDKQSNFSRSLNKRSRC